MQLFTRHDVARIFQQYLKELKRLLLESPSRA
jgi:hypothetical protein